MSRNHNKTDARHWWRSIRHSAKQALRSGREPEPANHRHGVLWDWPGQKPRNKDDYLEESK